jgi:hypothetical protein
MHVFSSVCAQVPAAAALFQMNYNNKAMLVGAMLVAGYDKLNGGQVRPLDTAADTQA